MKILKKILLFLAIFICIGILCECAARIFCAWYFNREKSTVSYSILKDYEQLRHLPAPYTIFKYTPNYKSKCINTNSLGYRGYEFKIEKKTDERRIIILGVSTAVGYLASSDSFTISGQLTQLLKENNYNNYSIFNMSVGGYISQQELLTLIITALKFQPDIILVIDGINDLVLLKPNIPEMFEIQEKLYLSLLRGDLFKINLSLINSILKNNLKSYFILNYLFTKNMLMVEKPTTNNVELNIANYSYNIESIYKICKMNNIKPYFFYQPILTEKTKKNITEIEHIALKKYKKIDEEMYGKMFEITRQKLSKYDCKFNDLRDIFYGEHSQIYYDHCHFNDTGNLIVAKRIFEIIKKDL